MKRKSKKGYRLCFMKGNVLYFSPDIKNEWGDDWDDAPAIHNAGEPYGRNGPCRLLAYEPYALKDTDLDVWSRYSVQEIIKYEMTLAASWDGKEELRAGMSMDRVERILKETGVKYGELIDHGEE